MTFFPGLHIDGGVCYLLWDRDFSGEPVHTYINNEGDAFVNKRNLRNPYFDYVIRDFRVLGIIEKVRAQLTFKEIVSYVRPFGIRNTLFNNPQSYEHADLRHEKYKDSIKIYGVVGIKGGARRTSGFINRSAVTSHIEAIDKYKIFFTTSFSTNAIIPPQVILANPGEVCTETFLLIGPFSELTDAKNCAKFIETDFFRFLLFYGKGTMHVTREVFSLIPLQDFSSEADIDWRKQTHAIDDQLYKKYMLSEQEISFVRAKVQSKLSD